MNIMLNFRVGSGGAVTGGGGGGCATSLTGSSGTNEKLAVRLGVGGDDDMGDRSGDDDLGEFDAEDVKEGGGVIMGTGEDIGGFVGVGAAFGFASDSDELLVVGCSSGQGSLDGGRRGSS